MSILNFEFCILKKLLDLAHETLIKIQGGQGVGININACQPKLEIAIYVLKYSACTTTVLIRNN